MFSRRVAACAVSLAAFISPAAAVPAVAQAPLENTITATGSASVKPTPTNRRNNGSIRRAVAEARDAGVGRAFDNARERASRLAEEADVTLGAVVAITDFAFDDFHHGVFGSGQYCGETRRPIIRRRDGRRRVVGYRTRRVCRVPPVVTTRVQVTFRIATA